MREHRLEKSNTQDRVRHWNWGLFHCLLTVWTSSLSSGYNLYLFRSRLWLLQATEQRPEVTKRQKSLYLVRQIEVFTSVNKLRSWSLTKWAMLLLDTDYRGLNENDEVFCWPLRLKYAFVRQLPPVVWETSQRIPNTCFGFSLLSVPAHH